MDIQFLVARGICALVLSGFIAGFGWMAFRPRKARTAPRSRFASILGIGMLALCSLICSWVYFDIAFDYLPHDLSATISNFLPDSSVPRLALSAGITLCLVVAALAAILMLPFLLLRLLLIPILAIKRLLDQEPGPFRKVNWPASGLGALLPQPWEKRGRIVQDSACIFEIEIDDVKPESFKSYCEKCTKHGFRLDGFVPPDDHGWSNPERDRIEKVALIWYSGCNTEGYRLTLMLNAEFIEVMTIRLQAGQQRNL